MSDTQYDAHSHAALIHGRYLVRRGAEMGEHPPLLVGCHGYGENAERHLAELDAIPGIEKWLVVAPAALHRFYNSKTGEVIGSWMTSQDREQAIADNVRYVSSVVAEAKRRFATSDTLAFAGFSQGVAMAWRAAVGCGWACDGLIALAGDVPPDVAKRRVAKPPAVLLGRGTKDEWYTEAKMDADLAVLDKRGIEMESVVFKAGHVWTDEFRAAAGTFLDRLRG
ncbi:MAG: phospholipase [Acidobacteriota bacterium]